MFLAEAAPPPGPWYTSGLFWAIVAVVVAVVAIPLSVWAAFRSANPRRALYFTSIAQRLLPQGMDQHIRMFAGDVELAAPHLVQLQFASRGRRDIPSSSYDGPIEVDLGTKIIAVLGRSSDAVPKVVPAPPDAVKNSQYFQIGPSLLTKNHRLGYTLLVEGRPTPTLRCSIADVAVHESPPPPTTSGAPRFAQLLMIILGLGVLVSVWLGQDLPQGSSRWASAIIKSVLIVGCLLVLLYPFGPIGSFVPMEQTAAVTAQPWVKRVFRGADRASSLGGLDK